MKYTCTICVQEHEGVASYAVDRPAQYWDVPEDKRESDVFLTTDTCVIADRFFFVRGCLDIPIVGIDDVFRWGVWVSLSEPNFFIFQDHLEVKERSHIGPFFGWLCTQIPGYPETLNLKTMVHIQDNGIRPLIVLEPTEHLLAEEQRNGIEMQRVKAILQFIEHE